MKFPSHLLGGQLSYAGLLWAVFYVLVTLITLAVAVFGDLTTSGWEVAAQAPPWLALFAGVSLVRNFMPLYVAHGQTRRQFGAHAAITVALYTPALSALITLGYALEAGLYHLGGWPQALTKDHLFTSATQVPLVFTEYTIEFVAWMVAGAFMGAAFYRWRSGGLLSLPVGLGIIILGESSIGAEMRLPIISQRLGLDVTPSLLLSPLSGLACFVLGLGLTWLVIRDIPLRNRTA